MSDFGDIRSLLAQPPGEDTFSVLCWMLGGEDTLVEEHVLVYVEEHLRRWPAGIERQIPMHWLDALEYASWAHPGLRFCNAFKFEDHSHHLVEDVQRAFQNPALANIKHVDLGSHWEARELLQAIGEDTCHIRPESLTVRYINLPVDELEAISQHPNFANLRVLDLRYTGLRDEQLMMLANSPTLRSLEELKLQGNRFTSEGIEALARSPILANVNTLDLRLNGVGAEGARALAESKYLGRLRWLDLHRRDVGGSRGAKALAESHNLDPNIRRFWRYHSSLSR
jgi:hypothetical protein